MTQLITAIQIITLSFIRGSFKRGAKGVLDPVFFPLQKILGYYYASICTISLSSANFALALI